MTAAPVISQPGIEALLKKHENKLAKWDGQCLVLVYGTYETGARAEFKLGERPVHVTHQTSVLGITAAWLDHQEKAPDTGLLVVTTRVDDDELDWDLRGHALEARTLTVDPDEVLRNRFGAARLDSRVWQANWLVESLLAAEPAVGWQRHPGVLTYDAALTALVGARLGLDGATLDMDRMLDWSRNSGPERWQNLAETERSGIKPWLIERIGPAVEPLLALIEAGRGPDAMALGIIGTALEDQALSRTALMAVGGLFPGVRTDAVPAFAAAVDATLTRWLSVAEQESQTDTSSTFQGVLAVLERADKLAGSVGLRGDLAQSTLLPSAFAARVRGLATALPDPGAATQALRQLHKHRLAGLFRPVIHAAEMAVRLARWLATSEVGVESVGSGVRKHLAEWGWVDHAIIALWSGHAGGVQEAAQAYRDLCVAAVGRRERLDEDFAHQLTRWVPNADAQTPQGALLVENVLATVAVPLAEQRKPLIVVLDGMSSAVATQLGEELSRRQSWLEATPEPDRRLAAVAVIPSVTTVSRTSLLTGQLASGDQAAEKEGFTAFWKRHRRQSRLFHENEVRGGPGAHIDPEVVTALSGEEVVGVVLNTIDDALRTGRQGTNTEWRIRDVRYLPELLQQAGNFGRPVVLVADHGHVLERGVADSPTTAQGEYGARWRTGDAGDGEVALHGPRVLEGDGRIVAPWREDIRYTQKRAGYHGGVALAELTAPILVLLPSAEALPTGWAGLAPEKIRPSWWQEHVEQEVAAEVVKPAKPASKPSKKPEGPSLFDPIVEIPTPSSLGRRVVDSAVYKSQNQYVRKAPSNDVIAGVIDALDEAGGVMSLSAIASIAGRWARNIDGFMTTVQRLLNVEGYAVFEPIDGGRNVRLDRVVLRQQFELGKS